MTALPPIAAGPAGFAGTGAVTADLPAAGAAGIADAPGRTERAASLLARARALRGLARQVNPVLAEAYARRAAELSLEAWARAVRSSPVPIDDAVHAASAA